MLSKPTQNKLLKLVFQNNKAVAVEGTAITPLPQNLHYQRAKLVAHKRPKSTQSEQETCESNFSEHIDHLEILGLENDPEITTLFKDFYSKFTNDHMPTNFDSSYHKKMISYIKQNCTKEKMEEALSEINELVAKIKNSTNFIDKILQFGYTEKQAKRFLSRERFQHKNIADDRKLKRQNRSKQKALQKELKKIAIAKLHGCETIKQFRDWKRRSAARCSREIAKRDPEKRKQKANEQRERRKRNKESGIVTKTRKNPKTESETMRLPIRWFILKMIFPQARFSKDKKYLDNGFGFRIYRSYNDWASDNYSPAIYAKSPFNEEQMCQMLETCFRNKDIDVRNRMDTVTYNKYTEYNFFAFVLKNTDQTEAMSKILFGSADEQSLIEMQVRECIEFYQKTCPNFSVNHITKIRKMVIAATEIKENDTNYQEIYRLKSELEDMKTN